MMGPNVMGRTLMLNMANHCCAVRRRALIGSMNYWSGLALARPSISS